MLRQRNVRVLIPVQLAVGSIGQQCMTLQSVTTVSILVRTLLYTILVRTTCFFCIIVTRVDEHIGDDRYRAKNANAADNNNEHGSTERTTRIFHMRIVPCLLLLLAHCAEHFWSSGNVGSHSKMRNTIIETRKVRPLLLLLGSRVGV